MIIHDNKQEMNTAQASKWKKMFLIDLFVHFYLFSSLQSDS